MIMTPFYRKFALTAHITSSIGWIGSIAAFLVLAIAGLTNADPVIVSSTYISMKLIAWFVILPFAFASLLSGLVQSFGTKWGFFRYYWVAVKLFLTIIATAVLLIKMKLINTVADAAASASISGSALHQLRIELLVHAVGGLLVILGAAILSVYKPWGKTRYGIRKQSEIQTHVPVSHMTEKFSKKNYIMIFIFAAVIIFLIFHLINGGIVH